MLNQGTKAGLTEEFLIKSILMSYIKKWNIKTVIGPYKTHFRIFGKNKISGTGTISLAAN